jgi:PAS domain S-box-containing protein
VLDAEPDGLVLVDADGVIRYVNRRLEALTDLTRQELIGRPVEVLVPARVRERHARRRERFARAPRTRAMGGDLEFELLCRDGTVFPVEIALAPVQVGGREMTAASVRDVRQQRAADRTRQRLIELLDLVPDAVLVTEGAKMQVSYANRAAGELIGRPSDQLVGTACSELLPMLDAVDAAAVGATIRAQGGTHAVGSCLVRTAAGELIPVESHVQLVDGEGGDAEGTLVVVIRDVRDRLAQAERLRLSEESFRAAFEQAPIGMAVTRVDEQGGQVVLRANQVLADLLGRPAAALVGADLEELAGPGRVVHRSYRRPGGRQVWLEVRSCPVELADEPGRTALVHVVDVTERHEVERKRAMGAAGSAIWSPK